MFYEDNFFLGQSYTFYTGPYSGSPLDPRPFADNSISSFIVDGGPDCDVILYGYPGFQGWEAHFPPGRWDLWSAMARGFHNDELSSFNIVLLDVYTVTTSTSTTATTTTRTLTSTTFTTTLTPTSTTRSTVTSATTLSSTSTRTSVTKTSTHTSITTKSSQTSLTTTTVTVTQTTTTRTTTTRTTTTFTHTHTTYTRTSLTVTRTTTTRTTTSKTTTSRTTTTTSTSASSMTTTTTSVTTTTGTTSTSTTATTLTTTTGTSTTGTPTTVTSTSLTLTTTTVTTVSATSLTSLTATTATHTLSATSVTTATPTSTTASSTTSATSVTTATATTATSTTTSTTSTSTTSTTPTTGTTLTDTSTTTTTGTHTHTEERLRLRNSGFERGSGTATHEAACSIQGWIVTASPIRNQCPAIVRSPQPADGLYNGTAAASGSYFLALRDQGSSVMQTVPRHNVGDVYKLNFAVAKCGPRPDNPVLRITVDGEKVGDFTPTSHTMEAMVARYAPATGSAPSSGRASVDIKFENASPDLYNTVCIDYIHIEEGLSMPARCHDIMFQGNMWSRPAAGVELRHYTQGLQWIGCMGTGCDEASFTCQDAAGLGMEFGTNSDAPLRAMVGAVHPGNHQHCASLSRDDGLFSAPSGDDDARQLCQQLGYVTGYFKDVGSTSEPGCPKVHWDPATSKWTSSYSAASAYGKMVFCGEFTTTVSATTTTTNTATTFTTATMSLSSVTITSEVFVLKSRALADQYCLEYDTGSLLRNVTLEECVPGRSSQLWRYNGVFFTTLTDDTCLHSFLSGAVNMMPCSLADSQAWSMTNASQVASGEVFAAAAAPRAHTACNETLTGQGTDYRGCQYKTRSGIPCQRWDSQTPHPHINTPQNFPQAGLEANFCRNPGGEPSIWCYTSHPNTRMELCDPKVAAADSTSTTPTAPATTVTTAWAERPLQQIARSADPSMCLAVADSLGRLEVAACDGSQSQLWYFDPP